MKRTKQTILDFERGNCWATAISCILDIPLDEVPNFCAKDTDTFDGEVRLDWYRRTVLWLRGRGLDLITFKFPPPAGAEIIPPEGLALITGKSPRNQEKLHVVVGRVVSKYLQTEQGWGHGHDLEFIHDPHPDDTFFDGSEPVEVSIIVRTVAA